MSDTTCARYGTTARIAPSPRSYVSKGQYYCSFREGETHIFDSQGNAEGKIRILTSRDGKRWKPLPLIGKQGYDLRDPKLSITPDGRLMVIVGGSIYRNRQIVGRIPQVLFSEDGRTFTPPEPIELDSAASSGTDWLWRVTWNGDTGYGVNYAMRPDGDADIHLVSTKDGIHYDLVATLPRRRIPPTRLPCACSPTVAWPCWYAAIRAMRWDTGA
ncbi:MAG: hypothetical protein L6V80_00420 [Bacteroidales bacterium]|nr:MAG: hypothetical protein L6V80_00420 [Bacteroidales bacterium]